MKKKRFLAGVLTAAMVLTSLPVTAFAEDINPVAAGVQVGSNTTLNEAIDAADKGAEITLLGDITESGITVDAEQEVIIDLNGNTITGYFLVYGKATIKNGTIDSTVSGKAGIEVNNEADRTLNPTLIAEDLVINSGRHAIRVDGGTVTIDGGTYTAADVASNHAVNISDGGKVTIKSGTFNGNMQSGTGSVAIRSDNSEVIINGGTFIGGSTGSLTVWAGTATVNGGTFDTVYADVQTEIKDGTFGTINKVTGKSISGGTFGTEPALEQCVDGYAPLENANGKYDVIAVVDYKINYELDGGVFGINDRPVEQYNILSEDITLLEPTRTGYTFEGWTDKDGNVVTGIEKGTTTGDKTFYANWEPITYTIAFNNGGGTGSMKSVTVSYEDRFVPENEFTAPTGKFFAGWAIEENGKALYLNGVPVEGLTGEAGKTVILYAVWSMEEVPELVLNVQTKTYDGQVQKFELDGYKIEYRKAGDSPQNQVIPVNAGVYDVMISKEETTETLAYYHIHEGGLIIEKAPLTATYSSETIRVGRTPALVVEVTGFVNGENAYTAAGYVAPTVTTDETSKGVYTLKPSGGDATNYRFEYVEGTLTIKKKSSDNTDSGSTGGSSSADTKNEVNVDKDANGSIKLNTDEAKQGDKVTFTVKPDAGFEVDKVTVTDEDGNKVKVSLNGDGTYSFTMPDSEVEIKAEFKEIEEEAPAEETKPAAPAEEGVAQESISLTIGNAVAMVDGMPVVNDVAPIIRAERTMLPIRFVAEALGTDVSWNEAEQKVTITKGDAVIEIFIGQPFALVNGQPVQLDAPAFIENGRTYLPLRFVAEALGATVLWDANTNTVTIIPGK